MRELQLPTLVRTAFLVVQNGSSTRGLHSSSATYLYELHVLGTVASQLLHTFKCLLEGVVQVVDESNAEAML